MNVQEELGAELYMEIYLWHIRTRKGFEAAAKHFHIKPYQARAVYTQTAGAYNQSIVELNKDMAFNKYDKPKKRTVGKVHSLDANNSEAYVLDALERLVEKRG